MHLATAVGTPSVALFGSTDPAVTGPFDGVSETIYKALPCAPCGNHPTCEGRYDCLRAITPDEVALAARAPAARAPGRSAVASLPQARPPSPSPSERLTRRRSACQPLRRRVARPSGATSGAS